MATIRLGLVCCLPCILCFLSGCAADDVRPAGHSPKIVEKKDRNGRLMIYTRTVAGALDGPYVWDEGVGRIEGCYSNGVRVGEWREWRRDGMLQSRVLYALDVHGAQPTIRDATYFADNGKPLCSVSNGVGIVPMFDRTGEVIGFSGIGMAEPYTVQYEASTGPQLAGSNGIENTQVTGQFYQRAAVPQLRCLSLYRDTNTLALEIRWDRGSGAVTEVYEHHSGRQPSRWTFAPSGEAITKEGERPAFLKGEPIGVPTLGKGALHFDHVLVYSNGTTRLLPVSAVR